MLNGAEGPRRWGKGQILGALAALVVFAAAIAVLVFNVPLLTVAIAGMVLLHPLMHFVGGHGHGASHEEDKGADGRARQEGHRH